MHILCRMFGHVTIFEHDKDSTKENPSGRSLCKICKQVFGGVGKVIITEYCLGESNSSYFLSGATGGGSGKCIDGKYNKE